MARARLVLTHAVVGPVGEVGEALAGAGAEEVVSHTPVGYIGMGAIGGAEGSHAVVVMEADEVFTVYDPPRGERRYIARPTTR